MDSCYPVKYRLHPHLLVELSARVESKQKKTSNSQESFNIINILQTEFIKFT